MTDATRSRLADFQAAAGAAVPGLERRTSVAELGTTRVRAALERHAYGEARAYADMLAATCAERIESAPARARARTGVARRLLDRVRGVDAAECDEVAHYEAILVALRLELGEYTAAVDDDDAHSSSSSPEHVDTSVSLSSAHVDTSVSLSGERDLEQARADVYSDIEARLEGVRALYEVVERLVQRADPLIDAYERASTNADQHLERARRALVRRAAHVSSHSRAPAVCPAACGCSLACELRALVASTLVLLVLAALVTS